MTPRRDVHELLAAVGEIPREAVPALLTRLAARLAEPDVFTAEITPVPAPKQGKAPERWLTVTEVATRLGRTPRWVYRRVAKWSFTSREGRSLLINEKGLEAHLERNRIHS